MKLSGEATFIDQEVLNDHNNLIILNNKTTRIYQFEKQDNQPLLVNGRTVEQFEEDCHRLINPWNPTTESLASHYNRDFLKQVAELSIARDIEKRVDLEFHNFIYTNPIETYTQVKEYIFDINLSPNWYIQLNCSFVEDEAIRSHFT